MNTIDFVKNDCNDLSCHIAATFLIDLQVIQECSSLPDDLTGYTASMIVYDDTTTIITIPGVISTPKNGMIHFEISAHDTGDLDVGMYNHYVNLITGSTIYRISEGFFEVAV